MGEGHRNSSASAVCTGWSLKKLTRGESCGMGSNILVPGGKLYVLELQLQKMMDGRDTATFAAKTFKRKHGRISSRSRSRRGRRNRKSD